jgi:hypothetical protein
MLKSVSEKKCNMHLTTKSLLHRQLIHKQSNIVSSKTCNRVRGYVHPYWDNAEHNVNDRVFYVFKLGRYNNKMYYHYGETYDIAHVILRLRKHLPYYALVAQYPIAGNEQLIDMFRLKLDKFAAKLPLEGELNKWDVVCFESDDIDEMNILSSTLEKIDTLTDTH